MRLLWALCLLPLSASPCCCIFLSPRLQFFFASPVVARCLFSLSCTTCSRFLHLRCHAAAALHFVFVACCRDTFRCAFLTMPEVSSSAFFAAERNIDSLSVFFCFLFVTARCHLFFSSLHPFFTTANSRCDEFLSAISS